MSLLDLFERGERKSQKGHFRNLLAIAQSDGFIDEGETELLTKIGRQLGLSSVQLEEITANPKDYPMMPPVSKEERTSRLIDLVEMVQADGEIDQLELNAVHRFAAGLGLAEEQTAKMVNLALNGMRENKDREAIEDELNA